MPTTGILAGPWCYPVMTWSDAPMTEETRDMSLAILHLIVALLLALVWWVQWR